MAPELRFHDPWVDNTDLPPTELWIDLIRLATNLQALQIHTPQYARLQLLDAVKDMAIAVITSPPEIASTLPLFKLRTLSSSLSRIGHRSRASCVDLTPRVSDHDWSCSAMLLPHLQRFDASYTECADPRPLAKILHMPSIGLNLREFRLSNCLFDRTFIQSLLSLHPTLRKLELILPGSDDHPGFDGIRVLQAILALGSHLEHLTIDPGRRFHDCRLDDLGYGRPSFKSLTTLRTLEICVHAIVDFNLGIDPSSYEADIAFQHHMHDLLPASIETLILFPRHRWTPVSRELLPCKRWLRAWLSSEDRPPALRCLGVGYPLKQGGEALSIELGGDLWLECAVGRAGGRGGHRRPYDLVRLLYSWFPTSCSGRNFVVGGIL
ncbi:hypothetical protein LTS14_006716 [Recurvomyces mirabilis]|uniref:uncharacterized protein n=1 Tax=Recurvomyces mirabilis TaxID=574656 RepID=UPI002DE12E5F|nr:hypothetical protein LTS14_006716 [Recurvomyces mirabilis]